MCWMRCTRRAARESDLGVSLTAALQQAIRERRLDIADHLLRAIEIHGADRTTEAAYLLLAKTAAEGSRGELQRRSGDG
jgi:hypothetical protein